VLVAAGHSSVRQELAQGESPILYRVGGNSNSFTNNCDASGAVYSRYRVCVSKLWVLIEEQTSHSKMAGHHVRVFRSESL
jgi:hypothetical protein